jgi:methionine sulfoxide reductase catalytic subunit
MLIQTHSNGFNHRASSEITPLAAYQGRRDMLKMLAGGAAGTALAGWAARDARAMAQAAASWRRWWAPNRLLQAR